MQASDLDSINLARQFIANRFHQPAFELILMVLGRCPEHVSSLEDEARRVLLKLNGELAECDRIEDIFFNFEKLLKIYPLSPRLLNDLGKYLFKYGYYTEAINHFEKVLHLQHECINAEKNLNSVKNLLVERWHFRMLNDKIRNEAYRRAIREKIVPSSDKVLDVGTGTGLLAIYARETGLRSRILACDGSETMTKLAKQIQVENRLIGIDFINKMSSDLTPEEMRGKANVLLTELFDAGLFGEHILQMLQHAWPSLLSAHARVIPNRAEFFIVGVQCNHLHMKYQLSPDAKKLLNIRNINIHIASTAESYDCEDVNLIEDLQYITTVESVLKINFNDLKDIEKNLYNSEPYKVVLQSICHGTIDTYIGWFTLYLSDTITISTDPRTGSSYNAWQQAIFYDEIPKPIKKNESFTIEFSIDNEHLTLKPTCNAKITRVSPEMIKFLNDADYMKTICSGIPTACVYLGQLADMSQTSICDLCPFPLFGMLMMRRGADSLTCCAKTEYDRKFITEVFNKNKIPLDNVTILETTELCIEDFGDEKYHAIFCQIIELGGDIDISLKDIAEKLKNDHLYTSGLYLPASVAIHGQLVSSRWLDVNNRLFDENVDNYKMAELVNRYSVSANYFIDFSILKYVPITDPLQVCSYPDGRLFTWNTTPVINDGHANAILCWYEIELMQDLKIVSTRRPNSFVDGMLFMTHNWREALTAGSIARIMQLKDEEGNFKLLFNLSVD